MHFKRRNACSSHPLIFLSQTHHLTALNDQYIQYPACMQGGREVSATTQLDQGVLLPCISLPFCVRERIWHLPFSQDSLFLSQPLSNSFRRSFKKKHLYRLCNPMEYSNISVWLWQFIKASMKQLWPIFPCQMFF